ncbi:hypothetical protein B1218_34140, partial [Pseudomonas ogarae]
MTVPRQARLHVRLAAAPAGARAGVPPPAPPHDDVQQAGLESSRGQPMLAEGRLDAVRENGQKRGRQRLSVMELNQKVALLLSVGRAPDTQQQGDFLVELHHAEPLPAAFLTVFPHGIEPAFREHRLTPAGFQPRLLHVVMRWGWRRDTGARSRRCRREAHVQPRLSRHRH